MQWWLSLCPDGFGWQTWLTLCAGLLVVWASAIGGTVALFGSLRRPRASPRYDATSECADSDRIRTH